jgi:hypothetical protein
MDREDWMYLSAAGLIAVGASLYSTPAGLIVLGVMLLIPLRASLAGRKDAK